MTQDCSFIFFNIVNILDFRSITGKVSVVLSLVKNLKKKYFIVFCSKKKKKMFYSSSLPYMLMYRKCKLR